MPDSGENYPLELYRASWVGAWDPPVKTPASGSATASSRSTAERHQLTVMIHIRHGQILDTPEGCTVNEFDEFCRLYSAGKLRFSLPDYVSTFKASNHTGPSKYRGWHNAEEELRKPKGYLPATRTGHEARHFVRKAIAQCALVCTDWANRCRPILLSYRIRHISSQREVFAIKTMLSWKGSPRMKQVTINSTTQEDNVLIVDIPAWGTSKAAGPWLHHVGFLGLASESTKFHLRMGCPSGRGYNLFNAFPKTILPSNLVFITELTLWGASIPSSQGEIITLAATRQIFKSAGNLFAWVETPSSSTSICGLKKTGHAHRRAASSLASLSPSATSTSTAQSDSTVVSSHKYPFPCCAVYGNPSIIDLTHDNAQYNQHIPTNSNGSTARIDWRARAQRTAVKDLKVERRRKDFVRRTKGDVSAIRKGEEWFDEIQAYEAHFKPLLEAERKEDEAVLRERLASWSLQRLQDEGYCITDMVATWQPERRFGRHLAKFNLGKDVALPSHHRFDKGTQVLVTHLGPLRETAHRGSVISTDISNLFVSFPERFKLDDSQPWRIDVGRSNIVFDRMSDAIKLMKCDPSKVEEAEAMLGKWEGWDTKDRELILQGTYLRDVLLRGFKGRRAIIEDEYEDDLFYADEEFDEVEAQEQHSKLDLSGLFKDDSRIASWARRYSEPDPVWVEGDPVLAGLNATQIRAVAMMLSNRVSLVQGPPGTGKTKTIIETARLLKVHFGVPHPILFCTFTNGAVDNVIEGLVAASLRPLRVGTSSKIKEDLSEYILEEQIENHHYRSPTLKKFRDQAMHTLAEIKKLNQLIRELKEKIDDAGGEGIGEAGERATWEAYKLYMEILEDVVKCADVVCTTCISSASRALDGIDCPIVLIDEASMSTEPATLVPLMKGSKHVALIGDHKQLPPVITSPEAQARGLGSAFLNAWQRRTVILPSIMLDVQYRMHPTISQFPSHEFYDKAVRDGTFNARGIVSPWLEPPLSSFIPQLEPSDGQGLDSAEATSPAWYSWIMWEMKASRIGAGNPNMRGKDIGIIAPYVAQISLLTRLFTTDPKFLSRFESVLGKPRLQDLRDITISTVDGFEGQEKDVIIFSTVRNNAHGHIGFLADRRRLNVGLTRAKRGLFIVGSINTLRQSKVGGDSEAMAVMSGVMQGADVWKRYAEYLSAEKLVIRRDEYMLGEECLLFGQWLVKDTRRVL
ncbi:P-loop containing nucleoside triphosphate hydrolase protein [Irpex lacteus]|nr:P-loop containing nucleoside triphosphate hydrolase protein [Irpex lacteus]